MPTLLLAQIDLLSGALGLAAGVVITVPLVLLGLKTVRGQTIASAKAEAQRLVDQAKQQAGAATQRAELDSERKLLERREKFEADLNQQREKMRADEQRLSKREELLDRKLESVTSKEESLVKQSESLKTREAAVARTQTELEQTLAEQKQRLLNLTGMSLEDARALLLQRVEEESRHDMAKVVRKVVDEAESHAKEKAREITLMAIQRYATVLSAVCSVAYR